MGRQSWPGAERGELKLATFTDMYAWNEEQLMIRDAVREFVEAEIAPKREELEFGDTPPYDLLRKLFATFGMD